MYVIDFIKKWFLTIIALIVFAWLTLAPDPLPDNDVGMWFEGVDKVVHGLMLWGVTCAVTFDYIRSNRRVTLRVAAIMFAWLIALSAADELAQSAMNIGRTGDALDLIADLIGIIVGLLTGPPITIRILSLRKK